MRTQSRQRSGITRVQKDIWQIRKSVVKTAIIIPTNGYVKLDGTAVMGKGLAFDAKQLFPNLPSELGTALRNDGNQVYYFPQYHLLTFPTKLAYHLDADITIIRRSCQQLIKCIELYDLMTVYMPRVGCGNGKLRWEHVQQILEEELKSVQDRIIIVEKTHATK